MSKRYVLRKVNVYPRVVELYEKSTKKLIAVVEYQKNMFDLLYTQVDTKIQKFPSELYFIKVDTPYINLLNAQPSLFECTILNEVGCKEYMKQHFENNEKFIEISDVDKYGDDFTIEEVGLKKFIKYLEWELVTKKQLVTIFEEQKNKVIQYIQNKIENIKQEYKKK